MTDITVAAPQPDQMAFLRMALNSPSLQEVKSLIHKELLDYHFLNKIELKKDDKTVVLDAKPRHFLFEEILQAANVGVNVALIGPAGSGKSTCCQQVAEGLSLPFYLQNSVTGTHELSGYLDAHGKYHSTSFRDAFEKGGFLLVDEVDTSDAGALKWVNTALANGYAMFPDKTEPVFKHKDFRIAIGANTFGTGADRMYVGANQLDASTLDRFVFFFFDYDEKMEIALTGNLAWAKRVQQLRKAAAEEKARVVISPRASISGAKLFGLGWKQETVEQRTIWKGMDEELRRRIEARVSKKINVLEDARNGSFFEATDAKPAPAKQGREVSFPDMKKAA